MEKSLALAAVLASMSAWACGNAVEEVAPLSPEQRMLFSARKALGAKKYQDALDLADAAAKASGGGRQLAWATRVKGEALLKLERAQEALPLLQSVLKAFPDDAVFLARLAQAEIETGKEEGGKRLEELYTDKMLPDGTAWFWLAKARQARGEVAPALAAVHQAARMNKGDAPTLQLLKELRKVKTM